LEIHAPHKPVHSLREMLTHLVLVTLGVLIALSFEGIGSWREHRALLHEARANILSELRDNQKELAQRLEGIPKERDNLTAAIDVAQRLMDTKKLEGEVQLGFQTADLRDASRTTAAVTGAFGLMDYSEVKKYATVYGHQELFLRAQTTAIENLTRTMAAVHLLQHSDRATARELEDWKMSLRLTIASLTVEEGLGQGLVKEYDRVLKGQEP
jgi:predicted xylose isomerase-like sugar epimerase